MLIINLLIHEYCDFTEDEELKYNWYKEGNYSSKNFDILLLMVQFLLKKPLALIWKKYKKIIKGVKKVPSPAI